MVNAIHVSFPSHDCHSTHAYRMRDWRLFIRYSKNQSYRKLDKIGHKLLPTYLLTSMLCIAFRDDIVTKLGFGSNKNISSLWRRPPPRSISGSLRPLFRLGSISSGREHQLRCNQTVVKYFMDSFVCETTQGSLFPCSGWLFIAPPPLFQLRFEKFCSSFIVVADYVPALIE